MPRKNPKNDAKDEEEVDYLTAAIGHFAGRWDAFVAQPSAAHGRCDHELCIVEDKQAEGDDYGPEVCLNSTFAIDIKCAVEGGVALHVDVVGAAEGQEAGDHDDVEEREVDGRALVIALTAEHKLAQAAPAGIGLLGPGVGQLAQPEHKQPGDEERRRQLRHSVRHEAGSVNVRQVERIVEEKQEKDQPEGSPLLKG